MVIGYKQALRTAEYVEFEENAGEKYQTQAISPTLFATTGN